MFSVRLSHRNPGISCCSFPLVTTARTEFVCIQYSAFAQFVMVGLAAICTLFFLAFHRFMIIIGVLDTNGFLFATGTYDAFAHLLLYSFSFFRFFFRYAF